MKKINGSVSLDQRSELKRIESARTVVPVTKEKWRSSTVLCVCDRFVIRTFLLRSDEGEPANGRSLCKVTLRNAVTYRRFDLEQHFRGKKRVTTGLEKVVANSDRGDV